MSCVIGFRLPWILKREAAQSPKTPYVLSAAGLVSWSHTTLGNRIIWEALTTDGKSSKLIKGTYKLCVCKIVNIIICTHTHICVCICICQYYAYGSLWILLHLLHLQRKLGWCSNIYSECCNDHHVRMRSLSLCVSLPIDIMYCMSMMSMSMFDIWYESCLRWAVTKWPRSNGRAPPWHGTSWRRTGCAASRASQGSWRRTWLGAFGDSVRFGRGGVTRCYTHLCIRLYK